MATTALPFSPGFTSLAEQIALHGTYRGAEIALIEGDQRLSWSDYNAAGNRIGNTLLHAGVARGDRVGMLVTNSTWAHEVLLGIWRAGAVAVPLSPMLNAEALNRMLTDAGVTTLFTSTEYKALADAAMPAKGQVVAAGPAFASWLETQSSDNPGITLRAEELAVIIYSSGTTGTPKGIAHSHGARLAFASTFAAEFRFHYRSVALSAIPMHSNGAWLSWSPAKWMGATTAILPAFTPDAFIDAVRSLKPTHGFIVPAMAQALLAHPDIENAGLTCFESAITAGSPMPEPVKREIQRLTGNALYELWGLTEGVATIMSPQDMQTNWHSVGRPILGCDLRIVNASGQDITFEGTGEIVGCSDGLLSGYWNRAEANADLVWKTVDGRTYIRTGDVGEFDEQGFLTLRGRLKDMILSGGLNVYPIDIESVLLSHAAISDAAVIGVDDDKWGEVPVAFVVLSATQNVDAASICDWVNERLAKHQRVREVIVYESSFPRNTLGKVMKLQLLQEYNARLQSAS
ncbi:class I adenylate-forming enzyme family protein [Woeseia oceani]|uniref:AMP-dependent synthetase n=1 Tax=Woeseia oceani TaxID=1548547 RepID=A0A193LDQ2_9GAMM|nr:AMP-binding protein [Woeseia oceani]ANO50571.1 hypothetical protein BA177_04485 [Woeseia oceani]